MSEESTTTPPSEADDSKSAVKRSLLGALGFIQGDENPDPDPDPKETDPITPPANESPNDEPLEVPPEEPGEAPEAPEAPVTVLSAKDLRVTRKAQQPAKIDAPEAPEAPDPVDPPTPEPEPTPEPDPEVDAFEDLAKNERATIKLLEFGEEKELTEAGTAKDLAAYYRKRNELVQKLESENEFEEDYNPRDDPQYRKWQRSNKPPVDASSLESIREERLVTTAEDRALERMRKEQSAKDEKWESLMKEQEQAKLKPQIERMVSDFSDQLLSEMPEEITASLKTGKQWEQIEEESPIEAPIVKSVLNQYADRAEVVISMMEGAVTPDRQNPLHSELGQFVNKQAKLLLELPKEKSLRNGKAFVSPSAFKGEEGTWTFSQQDILTMLKKKALLSAKNLIDVEQKKYSAIMKKQGAVAPDPLGAASTSSNSPRVNPSSSSTPGKGKPQPRKGLFDILS